MKRQDPIAIIAELDHITSDVRDLDVSPSRAAALQCLADAKRHLESAQGFTVRAGYDCRPDPEFVQPGNLPVPQELGYQEGRKAVSGLGGGRNHSLPPSATDNQAVRNRATEAFRESRRLLREAIK